MSPRSHFLVELEQRYLPASLTLEGLYGSYSLRLWLSETAAGLGSPASECKPGSAALGPFLSFCGLHSETNLP